MRRVTGPPASGSADGRSGKTKSRDRSRLRPIQSLGGLGGDIPCDRSIFGAIGRLTGLVASTTLRLVANDLPGKERERRRLEEAEPDPVIGQLHEPPSVVEPTAGYGAHLVVELGPAGSPTVVAEADKCRGLGGWPGISGPR